MSQRKLPRSLYYKHSDGHAGEGNICLFSKISFRTPLLQKHLLIVANLFPNSNPIPNPKTERFVKFLRVVECSCVCFILFVSFSSLYWFFFFNCWSGLLGLFSGLNRPPNQAEVDAFKFVRSLKRKREEEPERPAKQVYNGMFRDLNTVDNPDEVVVHLPAYHQVKSSFYHSKGKILPPLPQTWCDVRIVPPFCDTGDRRRFLIVDGGAEDKTLVFGTDENIQRMCAAESLYGWYFLGCPKIFYTALHRTYLWSWCDVSCCISGMVQPKNVFQGKKTCGGVRGPHRPPGRAKGQCPVVGVRGQRPLNLLNLQLFGGILKPLLAALIVNR